MAKLNFQQQLLQSSVSHDPSEIILICRFAALETFIIISSSSSSISVENSRVAFVETVKHFFKDFFDE